MTIATMADRSLPLADSVHDVIVAAMKAHRWTPSDEDAFWETADELLADIAAADRLARAASVWSFTRDAALDRLYAAPDPIRGTVAGDDEADSEAAYREYEDAMYEYRARMAQEVDRG